MSTRILCILAVFVFFSSASGQQPAAKAQTPADSKAQQELNKKAAALLTEIVQSARGLKNKDNRIVARVTIADLLWKDHEAAARVLYKEAFVDLRRALAGVDDSNPEATDGDRSLSQLRDQLLGSLGKHDPIMARDLLHESRLPPPSDSAESDALITSDARSSDTRLELSLATEMVNQDPKDAVRIAREALNEGYSYELMSLLPRLAEKEPKAAQELTLEIVNKLRKEDFGTNYEAISMASFLAHEVISSARVDPDEGAPQKQPPLLDQQASRDFIEFLIGAALKKQSGPAATSLLTNLWSMMEDLEQFAPAQASLLKQKSSEMDKENRGEDNSPYRRFQQLSEAGDTKAMLEAAATAPREFRDDLYAEAASTAWQEGDKTQANEIIARISNPLERIRLLTSFQEQTIADLIEKEEFVQARQSIAQLRSTEHRLPKLIDLATVVAARGDRKTAVEILQEAQDLIAGKAKNEYELEAQLRIAGAFASLDADRSFGIMGSAIDQINELMAATALIANFGPSGATIKDDEFSIGSSSLGIPYGFATLSSKDIRTLAQVDFTRTKALFDKFQRPETRIAGYLLMSRSILEPEPTLDDCTCQERLKKLKSKAANKPAP